MSKLLKALRYLPKQFVVLAALVAAIVSSVNVFAAVDVRIEGSLQVKNVTDNHVQYKDNISATYDEVVEFRVYYHNTELASSEKVAQNLSVKVNFPTDQGRTQEVMATIHGDNTNTVVDTATVSLNRPDAYLEFVSGSVEWEHNVGTRENIVYATESLSDNVVTSGEFVRIENQQPCFEYEAWITFQARVRVPSATIEKLVSVNDADWAETMNAQEGDTVKYVLQIKNTGNTVLNNVGVRDLLPDSQTLVAGSTKLWNSNHSDGYQLSDNIITDNGINIGAIAPGGTVYVTFRAEVSSLDSLECGMNNVVNTGQVVADRFSGASDTATVNIDKECVTPEPEYGCEILATVVDMKKRNVSAKITARHTDDVTVTGYSIKFGDGTTVDKQSASHTYSKDGTYEIVGNVTFNVNGQSRTAGCFDKVTISVTPVAMCTIPGKESLPADSPLCKPGELPNTGAGGILAALFGTGTFAGATHYWVASRRALKRSLIGA